MAAQVGPETDEILALKRVGMAHLWNTLKEKYGDPHGTYGSRVYDAILRDAASNASHNNPANIAPVNANSAPTEHHDPIALSNQNSTAIIPASNSPISQPVYNIINPLPLPLPVAMVPLGTRLKDWKRRVRKGMEAGIDFDPAQLAERLGYYDIAYYYRRGDLVLYILQDDEEKKETPRKPEDDDVQFFRSIMRDCSRLQMLAMMLRMMGNK